MWSLNGFVKVLATFVLTEVWISKWWMRGHFWQVVTTVRPEKGKCDQVNKVHVWHLIQYCKTKGRVLVLVKASRLCYIFPLFNIPFAPGAEILCSLHQSDQWWLVLNQGRSGLQVSARIGLGQVYECFILRNSFSGEPRTLGAFAFLFCSWTRQLGSKVISFTSFFSTCGTVAAKFCKPRILQARHGMSQWPADWFTPFESRAFPNFLRKMLEQGTNARLDNVWYCYKVLYIYIHIQFLL